MHLRRNTILISFILIATLFATACPQRETISRINADPGRYNHKEVTIAGTVTDSYGLLNMGVYEVDDGTGKLLVVTRRGIPSRGSKVGAKGHVYNGFSFGGRNLGTVLEETDRRAR